MPEFEAANAMVSPYEDPCVGMTVVQFEAARRGMPKFGVADAMESSYEDPRLGITLVQFAGIGGLVR